MSATEIYEDVLEREPIRNKFYDHLDEIVGTETKQIDLICEGFTHDFLKSYYGEIAYDFNLKVRFEGTSDDYDDYATILEWSWESRNLYRSVLFMRHRNYVTFEDYEAEIKGYLFDLIVMMLNI